MSDYSRLWAHRLGFDKLTPYGLVQEGPQADGRYKREGQPRAGRTVGQVSRLLEGHL